MINAPHEREFVFHDGSRSRNILELAYKIESMSDHAFSHFVNHSKNDFANWISHVLHDHLLAEKLRETHSRETTLRLIKDRVAEISQAATHKPSLGGSIFHPHPRPLPTVEQHHEAIREEHHKEPIREHHIPPSKHDHKVHDHRHPEIVKPKTEFDGLNILESKGEQRRKEEKHADKKYEEKHAPIKELKETKETKETKNSENPIPQNPGYDPYIPKTLPSYADMQQIKSRESGRNWFRLFSKKSSTEKRLETFERKEEHKQNIERELSEEISNDGKENMLWIALYFSLILLIVALLVYKLFILK